MNFGTSIFLIAVGAILRYAITTRVSGFSLTSAGLILMIVGAVGLLLSCFWVAFYSDREGRVASRARVLPPEPPAEY
jgi:hypothetical protein